MTNKPVAAGKSSFDHIDTKTFLNEISELNHETVADFASGIGNYTFFLSENLKDIKKIYALDLWEDGVKSLKEKAEINNNQNIEAIHCDLSQSMPLGENSIDLALMATIVHDLAYTDQFKESFENIRKTVKPGGHLAVIEFQDVEPPPGPPPHIRISPDKLKDLIENYDFNLIRSVNAGNILYISIFQKK